MTPVPKMPRVVYVEEGLTRGERDSTLASLSKVALERKLRGLCTTETPTQNDPISIGLCGGTSIEAPWPRKRPQPYNTIRSLPTQDWDPLVPRNVSKEPFSYAKALIRSDEELERLSSRIRSELHVSELQEVAAEAELAAAKGRERFRARLSTYSDEDLKEEKNLHPGKLRRIQTHTEGMVINPGKLRRRRTHTEGMAIHVGTEESNKLPVLALRSMDEVVPDFRKLHSHMRTHFFCRDVDEMELVFRETLTVKQEMSVTSSTKEDRPRRGHHAKKSLHFFQDFAAMKIPKLATNEMMSGTMSCERSAIDQAINDDAEESSDCAGSIDFGTALSSHISPGGGERLRLPPLTSLPGLLDSIGDPTLTVPNSKVGQTENLATNDALERKTSTTASMSSSSSSLEDGPNTAATDDHTLVENGILPSSFSLFDAVVDADDASSTMCPASPVPNYGHSSIDSQTPPAPKVFMTPARLRDIRNERDIAENRGNGVTVPSTPDLSRFLYEPSSIVDSGEAEIGRATMTPLPDGHENFLLLPSIQNTSEGHYERNIKLGKKFVQRRFRAKSQSQLTSESDFINCRGQLIEGPGVVRLSSGEPKRGELRFPGTLSATATLSRRTMHTMERNHTKQRNNTANASVQDTNVSFTKSLEFDADRQLKPANESCVVLNKYTGFEDTENIQNSGEDAYFADETDTVATPAHVQCSCQCMPRCEHAEPKEMALDRELRTSLSWGGYNSETPPAVRETLSWPLVESRELTPQRLNDEFTEIRVNSTPRGANSKYTCNSQPIIRATRSNACPMFPRTDENFKAAVEVVMAGLSPRTRHFRKPSYHTETENVAFLKNYFYCAKGKKEAGLPNGAQFIDRPVCADSCNEPETMCQYIGMETMWGGFSSFFEGNPGVQRLAKLPEGVENMTSLSREDGPVRQQSRGWMSLFRLSRFNRVSGAGTDSNAPKGFELPHLETPDEHATLSPCRRSSLWT